MSIEWTTVPILAIIFVATLVRSAFGFGEALVAVPLLALVMPVEVAAPLAVLLSITVAGVIIVQDRQHIEVRSAAWLILFTVLGIPVGLLLLTSVAEAVIKAILGIVIVAFSLYYLIRRSQFELKTDRLAWFFGFSAGVLGGAYGMNGPPLVIYGAMRRWPAQHFRATLQGYFLPASIMGMAGYGLAGLWTQAVTHYYLLSLPVAILGVFLGRVINHRLLHGDHFYKYLYLALIFIGALFLLQAIGGH